MLFSARYFVLAISLVFFGCSADQFESTTAAKNNPERLKYLQVSKNNQAPHHYDERLVINSDRLERGKASGLIVKLLPEVGINLSASSELKLINRSADKYGYTYRMQQYDQGYRVEGAQLVAVFGREGRLLTLHSSVAENLNLDLTKAQSDVDATKSAQKYMSRKYSALAALAPVRKAELLIVKPFRKDYELAWRFTIADIHQIDIAVTGDLAGDVVDSLSLNRNAAKLKIYNASLVPVIPTVSNRGILVLEDGKETREAKIAEQLGEKIATRDAEAAHRNLNFSLDFYQDRFKRNSYDGKGATIHASVEVERNQIFDIFGQSGNASWNGLSRQLSFGAGTDRLDNFARSLDVVGHEYTHAVIEYTSNLKYFGQSGALNEHFADLMGEMIQRHYEPSSTPFLLGEHLVKNTDEPLRNMLDPNAGYSEQPAHMNEIDEEYGADCEPGKGSDNCGVHSLSGIPNRVSSLIISKIGWDKPDHLFYRVMALRLLPNSDFKAYKYQMMDECSLTMSKQTCAEFEEAFKAVGL